MKFARQLTTVGASFGNPFPCPGAAAVSLTVMNAPVEIELGTGTPGIAWTGSPSFRLPGVHVIPGPVDAIRVRAAGPIVAGKEPRYAADAW